MIICWVFTIYYNVYYNIFLVIYFSYQNIIKGSHYLILYYNKYCIICEKILYENNFGYITIVTMLF